MQKLKIKIYFDSSPLKDGHAVRGIGYYTENLLDELKKNEKVELVDDISKAEVVHYPYFDFFQNTLNLVAGKKNVVTIYDTIPLIYPKHYPSGLRGKVNFIRQKRKLSKISAVITISETSKKDIVRFLDVPQDKVFPIHLAPSSLYRKLESGSWELKISKKYSLPKKFVLYVGDVNYNKNLCGLAEACLSIDVPLVIVGKQALVDNFDRKHPENISFAEFIDKYGNNPKIMRLGFVEKKDLVDIFNLTSVYCQPSLYEGFGLPILEAMSCGTPVVATKIQSTQEIVENSCLYSKSFESKSIAASIKNLLKDEKTRRVYSKLGLEITRKYSWKKTVERTIKVYENLI